MALLRRSGLTSKVLWCWMPVPGASPFSSPLSTHAQKVPMSAQSVASTPSARRTAAFSTTPPARSQPGQLLVNPTEFTRLASTSTDTSAYTASFAFFEAIWEAGITHYFVNLGSDHPSIIEAIIKGKRTAKGSFPRIITCPNEMVAMSMADGYARLTGKPQCVIVHVHVGTQGLRAAVHNASTGRAPVLLFAGLSPFTIDGEQRGSRTEFIHWIQDVPDQKQIVAQYCRYSGEIKTGANVKQMINRALQFAKSDPQGPVYLCGAREVMEADIKPYSLRQSGWEPVHLGGLPQSGIDRISDALSSAKRPVIITAYGGRNHEVPGALVELANMVKGLQVVDSGGAICASQPTIQAGGAYASASITSSQKPIPCG